jgi:hypothetical protein
MSDLFLDLNFLGAPLFDGMAMLTLVVRLAIDLLVISLLVFGVYRAKAEDSQGYVFTFFIFNLVIFFICHLLSAVELSMGFAFGLFALFSILRYRTVTINIREMAFLFVVISVAIVNALPYRQLSWTELVFIDLMLLGGAAVLHTIVYREPVESLVVKYEKVHLLVPERRQELLDDLRKRTGMDIRHIRVEQINLMTDSADIRIYTLRKGISSLPQEP